MTQPYLPCHHGRLPQPFGPEGFHLTAAHMLSQSRLLQIRAGHHHTDWLIFPDGRTASAFHLHTAQKDQTHKHLLDFINTAYQVSFSDGTVELIVKSWQITVIFSGRLKDWFNILGNTLIHFLIETLNMTIHQFMRYYVPDYFLAGSSNFLESLLVAW